MDRIKKVKQWKENKKHQFVMYKHANRIAAFRLSDDKFFQAGDKIKIKRTANLYKEGQLGIIQWFHHDYINVVVRIEGIGEFFAEINDIDWN